MNAMEQEKFKLSDQQIEAIVNRLAPLIAAPADQAFFRAVLRIKAEESTSSAFAHFVSTLLKSAEKEAAGAAA